MVKNRIMADPINITLDLEGRCGEAWPTIRVFSNNQLIYDDTVCGIQHISFDLEPQDLNEVVIQHHGKINDTKMDEQGNIIADRCCILHALRINNVPFDVNFFSEHQYHYETDDGERLITSYFGKNGAFSFKFEYPLWKFWYQAHIK